MPKRITALAYTAARAEYAEYHNQREAMDCAQVAAWKAGGPEPLWLRKMRRTGHMPVVQIGRDDVAGIVNRHIQGASYEQIGAETGLDPDVIRYLIEEGDPDGDDPPK